MSELSDQARRALAEYRATRAVSTNDKARMWARLHDSVARGHSAASAEPAVSPTPRRPIDRSRSVVRIGVALAAAAAVLLLIRASGWLKLGADTQPDVHHDQAAYGAAAREQPAEHTRGSADPPLSATTASREAPTPDKPAPVAPPPAVPPTARPELASSTAQHPPSEPKTTTNPLREEIALLKRARRALERGDTDAALRTLQAHARRYPQGQMAEDRAALRPQVLCAAGRGQQALAAAVAFATGYPRSAHADKVSAVRQRALQKKCPAP